MVIAGAASVGVAGAVGAAAAAFRGTGVEPVEDLPPRSRCSGSLDINFFRGGDR